MFPIDPTDGQQYTDPTSGITYQWTLDDSSTPEDPSGRWIVRGSAMATPDMEYLRLDCTNGPLISSLEVVGSIDINARTIQRFRTPDTKGEMGDIFFSMGDGTTTWGTISILPPLP
jgi:hypothetical protein